MYRIHKFGGYTDHITAF